MKKLITLTTVLLMILTMSACQKQEEVKNDIANNTVAEPQEQASSIGDIFLNANSWEMDPEYIKVVTENYVYEANMPSGLYEEMDKIDFMSEDRDQQYAELLKSVAIDKATPREVYKLTDEQISSLIGQKGQGLEELGYHYFGWDFNEEQAKIWIENNGYSYCVTLEEHYEESDDNDTQELLNNGTIVAIEEMN